MNSGVLKYKPSFDYLGVIVSDTGLLKVDVKTYIERKTGNVSVKYTNFCKSNKNAPLHVKLDILDKCVTASIIYACETWGNNVDDAERCYRAGLKTALNVRQNLNNEIVHIETGRWPLRVNIKRQQLNFWIQMKEYMSSHPESALTKVYNMAVDINPPYVKYYKKLEADFGDPKVCEENLRKQITDLFKQKLERQFHLDSDSKLGTYYQINPSLSSCVPYPQTTLEAERELVTRFRTGSHSLAVETGRYANIARENRLCSCGEGVQTVWHVFTECPRTRPIVEGKNYETMNQIFDDDDVHFTLLAITKELKIQIW